MRLRIAGSLAALLLLSAMRPPGVAAGPDWKALIPFAKRVDADPNKSYDISEEHGPWLILATSFAGPGAERQAQQLVLELRKRYNLAAYAHRRSFDFTKPVVGLGVDRYGEAKRMRHRQAVRFDEIAVLVGDFETIDDEQLQRTLEELKYAHPQCLDLEEKKRTTQRFAGLRALHRRLTSGESDRERGPMGKAFVTRNPLLPEEYFRQKGLDSFVIELNEGVEFSLLENESRYSVRVATFRGETTMNLQQIARLTRNTGKVTSKLEVAADKAHRLTMALRKRGVEAYEFHDRHESIVTIGSFESVGTPRADGKTEINPAVHAVIQTYGAQRRQLGGVLGLQPRVIDGITLDVQPLPVEVPRRSIGATYARSPDAAP